VEEKGSILLSKEQCDEALVEHDVMVGDVPDFQNKGDAEAITSKTGGKQDKCNKQYLFICT